MKYKIKVAEYITTSNNEHAEIMTVLRKLIHENINEVSEDIKWGFPVFSKESNLVYFRTTKTHVTLGFNHIDKLQDYAYLLKGTGKTMKHIEIKSSNEIDQNLIISILLKLRYLQYTTFQITQN